MIVVDVETSGLDLVKCGIWQIGAIDLETGEEFLEEGRIDDEDMISDGALKVIGKTEEELRDPGKRSQKELLKKFFDWVETRKIKNALCQVPSFDIAFFGVKARKYDLNLTLHWRPFDLHNIAQLKYHELNGHFSLEGDHSNMGLDQIMKFCGISYERKEHDALEDVRLTAECFSRLIYGKSLFEEFEKYQIPDYLKKEILVDKSLDSAITVRYKNYRGEIAERKIIPLKIYFGENEYHKGKQWLMDVYDLEKEASRTYALKDIEEWIKFP